MSVLLYLIQLVPTSIVSIWVLFIAEVELPLFIRVSAWALLLLVCVVVLGFIFIGEKQINSGGK